MTGTFSNALIWPETHSYNQKTKPYCPYSFFAHASTFFSPSSKGKLSLSFSLVFEKQLITGEECITTFIFSPRYSSRNQQKTLAFIKAAFQVFGSSGINTAQSRRIDFYWFYCRLSSLVLRKPKHMYSWQGWVESLSPWVCDKIRSYIFKHLYCSFLHSYYLRLC